MSAPLHNRQPSRTIITEPPSIGERAFLRLQKVLPRKRLSALVYRLSRSRRPWLKNLLIRSFMQGYGITLNEALVKRPDGFASFNDFFTRALEPHARPLPDDPDILVSPSDGRLVRADAIAGHTLLQAKGHEYTLQALLGGHPRWERYPGGSALTIYLAPTDYHRVHMPFGGKLAAASHIPGDRFSVNAATTKHLPGLFTRNERVVCHFDTALGPMAVVLVGALNVGSISTVWAGEIVGGNGVSHREYPTGESGLRLTRGAELGRFNMGSTVILLLPPQATRLDDALSPGQAVRMGEPIAHALRETSAVFGDSHSRSADS